VDGSEPIGKRQRMIHLLKQGRMPAWRLAFWAILAMAGVGYFIQGASPHVFWGCVLMTGAMIVGFAYWLYWVQSSQWCRRNAFWLVGLGTLLSALAQLLGMVWGKGLRAIPPPSPQRELILSNGEANGNGRYPVVPGFSRKFCDSTEPFRFAVGMEP
jgi:hypothetical protein